MVHPVAKAESAARRVETRQVAFPEGAPGGTRGLILKAALQLFAERGYSGTSVRDIAAVADLQATTMYLHYPSKEHVLAELCRIAHQAHLQAIRNALLACSPDPRAQLSAFIHAHVLFHASFPMLAVVGNTELHMLSRELGAATMEIRKQSMDLLFSVLQRGADAGTFEIPNIWLAAAMVGSPGLRVAHWYTADSEFSAEQVAEGFADYALRMLRPQPRK
jgi:AcrR family transcriptional regulator